MTQIVQAVVPCRIDYLDGVATLLESLCSGITETTSYQIMTAFSEAFTNVVRHSELKEEDPVEVHARRDDDRLEVNIIDEGISFEKAFEQSREKSNEDRLPLTEGGMGLYIIHQYMHEVTYIRGEQNTLSMVRYLHLDHEVV